MDLSRETADALSQGYSLHTKYGAKFVAISAATGDGKSTLLPPKLLQSTNIVEVLVLMPTRIAAAATAEFVSKAQPTLLVAHVVSGVKPVTADPGKKRILQYQTTAIGLKTILRRTKIGGLFLDEAHIINPALVAIMLYVQYKDLGMFVVLLSATLPDFKEIGILRDAIPVFMGNQNTPHTVTHRYMRRYHIDSVLLKFNATFPHISHAVMHAIGTTSEEDSLHIVLMPGLSAIRQFRDHFRANYPYTKARFFQVSAQDDPTTILRLLHMFKEKWNKLGFHVIVLATNVIETSITIDGTTMIDPGVHKVNDEKGLYPAAISSSNLRQRAGRMGRIRPGSYLALFHEEDVKPPTFERLFMVDAFCILEFLLAGEDPRNIYGLCTNTKVRRDFDELFANMVSYGLVELQADDIPRITRMGKDYLEIRVYDLTIGVIMLQCIHQPILIPKEKAVLVFAFIYIALSREILDIPPEASENFLLLTEYLASTYRKFVHGDDIHALAKIAVDVANTDDLESYCDDNRFVQDSMEDFRALFSALRRKYKLSPVTEVPTVEELTYIRRLLLAKYTNNVMVAGHGLETTEFINLKEEFITLDPRTTLCDSNALRVPDSLAFGLKTIRNTTTEGDVSHVSRINLVLPISECGLSLDRIDDLRALMSRLMEIPEEKRQAAVRARLELVRESIGRSKMQLQRFITVRKVTFFKGQKVTQRMLPRFARRVLENDDAGTCFLCQSRPKDLALLVCGHWGCIGCWGAYEKMKHDDEVDIDCPICRQKTFCVYTRSKREQRTAEPDDEPELRSTTGEVDVAKQEYQKMQEQKARSQQVKAQRALQKQKEDAVAREKREKDQIRQMMKAKKRN